MQDDIPEDFQYLVDGEFYVKAYERYKKYDKPYISLLWKGDYYPVYNKLLYEFLSSEAVEVVLPAGKNINGTDYAKSYAEGFNAGKNDFEQYWPAKVFQGDNADAFVNSLHRKCFHEPNQIFEDEEGWIAAAQRVPYLINHTAVKYYGFFSAKLARYDQLADNYKEIFEKLVKCEYGSSETNHSHNIKAATNPERSVIISPKAHQRLYEILKPLVEIGEHPALSGLIFENSPPKPITHKVQQNTLAYIFWQLIHNHLMYGTQTGITDWICSSFKPATRATILDVIKGDVKPKKGKQIIIKTDDLKG